MEYFSEGKRGKIFLDTYKGKKVAIKKEKRNLGRIKNEAKWLRKLNKYNIGPKLIKSKGDQIIYGFIEGEPFIDFYRREGKEASKDYIYEIIKQCRMMDKLGVNKFEMHKPIKHILVSGKKVIFIDFERCTKTDNPKNVTQVCEFLVRIGFVKRTKQLTDLLKKYKSERTETNYKGLIRFILG
ncbi:MAG: hypothetical protein Q8R00_04250 [Candidatus Nanoarchaeia archaeon]|nr:hypothetical protein [Candidatus Nanoarchaeia archaeon]